MRTAAENVKAGDVLLEGAYEGPVSIKGSTTGKGTVRLQIVIAGPRNGLNLTGMSVAQYLKDKRSMELIGDCSVRGVRSRRCKTPPTPVQWARGAKLLDRPSNLERFQGRQASGGFGGSFDQPGLVTGSPNTPTPRAGHLAGKIVIETVGKTGDKIKILQYFAGHLNGLRINGPVQRIDTAMSGRIVAQSTGRASGGLPVDVSITGALNGLQASGTVTIKMESTVEVTFNLKNRYRLGDVGVLGVRGLPARTTGGPKTNADNALEDMMESAADKVDSAAGFLNPPKDRPVGKTAPRSTDGFVDDTAPVSEPGAEFVTPDESIPEPVDGSGFDIVGAFKPRRTLPGGIPGFVFGETEKKKFSTGEKVALGVAGVGAVAGLGWLIVTR